MKMPGNMQAMMQQAQKMQQKMQEEIALIRVEATALRGLGGGLTSHPYIAKMGRSSSEQTVRLSSWS